tara:strand:+ start:3787 stop:4167 length:381 start_codon:yes stop_codon:yes gene_type:complete
MELTLHLNQEEVTALFNEWNHALQTGDPKKIVALYESNAVLLPTASSKVRHNHEEIEDYFVYFMAKQPTGRIDESNVRIFSQMVINSGLYTFAFKDKSVVQARFTFVYRWNGVRWMIIEHHSSPIP